MITHNGKQVSIAMRNRKAINLIARNGKAMFGEYGDIAYTAIDKAANAVILAEYGKQVWQDVRDYAKAHPAIVPFINQDPHLAASISPNSNKERYIHATSNLRAYIDVWTATDLKIVTKCATDGTTGGTNDTVCGSLGWNSSWSKCDVGSFLIGFDKRSGQSFCYGTEHNWFNAIYARSVKANTPYILDADYSRFIAYDINGNKLVQQNNTYYWTEGNERQMSMMGVGVIVYDCKIYKGGELYRHIVPFQGKDGACLVDIVNGTAYYSDTSGQFTIAITDKE